ncbi:MAG: NTP-binding protein [Rhodospirillales bacterium]|nr:NTP-binding protein [Rhodospirillales bacterium]
MPPCWLDHADEQPPAVEILAVENGLLHTPSRTLLPHTPTFFNVNALPFAYEPTAACPGWLSFLNSLWPDDPSSIATLQEWFGYALLPDTSQQKILLLIGQPCSGKGTIARILHALLGIENVASPTLSGLATNFGLEPLIGKLLATVADARLSGSHSLVVERLLSISGEDALTVDRKNRTHWTGKLDTRIMVLTNELPRFHDQSSALPRRFIVLRTAQSFYGREDPGLTQRLLVELPGILNWALAGLDRLRERGHFLQPESGQGDVELLHDAASPVSAFVRDCCRLDPAYQCRRTISITPISGTWRRRGIPVAGQEHFARDLLAAVVRGRVRDASGVISPPLTSEKRRNAWLQRRVRARQGSTRLSTSRKLACLRCPFSRDQWNRPLTCLTRCRNPRKTEGFPRQG